MQNKRNKQRKMAANLTRSLRAKAVKMATAREAFGDDMDLTYDEVKKAMRPSKKERLPEASCEMNGGRRGRSGETIWSWVRNAGRASCSIHDCRNCAILFAFRSFIDKMWISGEFHNGVLNSTTIPCGLQGRFPHASRSQPSRYLDVPATRLVSQRGLWAAVLQLEYSWYATRSAAPPPASRSIPSSHVMDCRALLELSTAMKEHTDHVLTAFGTTHHHDAQIAS
jgi:hypothetical protein